MPSYRDLILDLSEEVGHDSKVVARLPRLIREVEDELWPLLDVFGKETVVQVTVPAGQAEVAIDASLWLEVLRALRSDGRKLLRASVGTYEALRLENSEMDLRYFCWPSSQAVKFWAPPTEDETVSFVVLLRDEPLQDGDTEANKWFLGRGYGLLRYGVLARCVFNPERWPAWKQEYERRLNSAIAEAGRLRRTFRGDDGRRWF